MPHEFQSRLDGYQNRVNAALDKYLPSQDPPEHNLAEAIRYSVMGGGKRIRPGGFMRGSAPIYAPKISPPEANRA